MPVIDWEHAPEFQKMTYEELEACAMRDWYDLAYANERIGELESLVRDWHSFAIGNGLDQSCSDYDEWLELERRMRELGITERGES